MQWLHRTLAHPKTLGLDINHPVTTNLRREIIQQKPFLRSIYEDWYQRLSAALPPEPGSVLELGSGAGFLSQYVPGLITSEIFFCQNIRLVADAQQMPFSSGSLRGIVMTDVLHHIPQPRRFFAEAVRCLRAKGVIVMVEPWVTWWGRLIYQHLHHEPFAPDAAEWTFPSSGPLSGANGALPWIVLQRDRSQFEQEFPELRIRKVEPFMPFRYLVSGGVSMRNLMPAASTPLWRALESFLSPWRATWAMFAFVVIEKEAPG
jgi:SAM-dependent methyltransferase